MRIFVVSFEWQHNITERTVLAATVEDAIVKARKLVDHGECCTGVRMLGVLDEV